MIDLQQTHNNYHMSTITTTIRWSKEELDKVKKSAQEIGLPVALFVKSLTLVEVNKQEPSLEIIKELMEAQKEARAQKVDTFDSVDELLIDLKKYLKRKNPKKPRTEYYEDGKGNFGLIFPDGMDAREVLKQLKKADEQLTKISKKAKPTIKRKSL